MIKSNITKGGVNMARTITNGSVGAKWIAEQLEQEAYTLQELRDLASEGNPVGDSCMNGVTIAIKGLSLMPGNRAGHYFKEAFELLDWSKDDEGRITLA